MGHVVGRKIPVFMQYRGFKRKELSMKFSLAVASIKVFISFSLKTNTDRIICDLNLLNLKY